MKPCHQNSGRLADIATSLEKRHARSLSRTRIHCRILLPFLLVTALTVTDLLAQVYVGAGNNHTCALTPSNTVKCWGRATEGQLGYGNGDNIGDNELPNTVGVVNVGADVTMLSVGQFHNCVVTPSNTVRCWGLGNHGRLGYGNTDTIGNNTTPNTAGEVDVGTLVSQVSAGYLHTCAVTTGNAVRCWGSGVYGRLGYGNTTNIGDNELPSTAGDVDVGTDVSQVSAGGNHTCVMTTGNTVRCWGRGSEGQLGYGNPNWIGDNEAPSSVGDAIIGADVSQISAGNSHTCAVTTGNTVRCWGWGGSGQLGYGNTDNVGDNETPSSVGDVNIGADVAQLSAGGTHNCVLTMGNTVRCWGFGGNGQLGYGNTNNIGDDELPSSVGDVDVGADVSQVSAGEGHTCVVTTGGAVRCWGFAGSGQLGCGNRISIGDDETPQVGWDLYCSTAPLPVELTDFNARVDHNNRAQLSWNTASESQNAGFEIHRLFTRSGQEFFDVLGFVNGAGTTTEAQNYRFQTESLEPGQHRFRLKQIDFDGQFAYSPEVEVVIEVPGTHVLNAAYPNPFNPRSSVSFLVAQEQAVTLTLHDATGRMVKTLFQGSVPAQTEQWATIDGEDLSSGVYFYRLTGEYFVESQMVTLAK